MPDNLTKQFKEQLRQMRKTSGIADVAPMPPTGMAQQTRGGRTLAEIAGIDYTQQPDESGNLLTALAKGVWQFGETATFGIPRLLYTEEFKKMLEPKGFAERVGQGVGGAAGFLMPMKWAGGIMSKAVQSFAKGGVKQFSKKFVDDSVRIMEQDKNFMSWVNKKVQRGEIQEGAVKEFMEGILQEPKSKLLSLGTKEGEALLARTVKDRMNFAKNFRDNTPKVLLETLQQAGFGGNQASRLVNTLGDDIAQRIGTVGDVSKAFKFPVTRLHQVIAGWTGNGRIGNLAAHAVEEAVLFAAVETPMNLIHSMAEEDVDFSLGDTLGHAFVLGSALGLIRMVPGGKDQPLLRTGWNRITNSFKNRKKWRNYELEPNKARGIGSAIVQADRARFATEVKNVFEYQPNIFKDARKLIKADKKRGLASDYEIPIRSVADIDELLASKVGRTKLKRIMGDVEKAFLDNWYPEFLRAIPGDLIGSSPRMLMGAMAFNFETYKAWMDGGVPDMDLRDIMFHTALGMFLSKRGKKLEYTDSSTGELKVVHKDRPLIYGNEFKKVDKYLQMLGSNLDASLYRAIFNEQETLRRGFKGVNTDSNDMKKLKDIADKNDIIVERYSEETTEDGVPIERQKPAGKVKTKDKKGKDVIEERQVDFDDEVYSTFAQVIKSNFAPKNTDVEYDVKEAWELDQKVLDSIRKDLKDEKFDSLVEFTLKGKPGITTSGDVIDVVLGSSEVQATAYRDIVQRFALAMYNKINLMSKGDNWNTDPAREAELLQTDFSRENTKLILPPLDTPSKINVPSFEHSSSMLGENSNIMRMLRPWVKFSGDPIRVTQEMINEVFGEWRGGERDMSKEAIIDKYQNELNELIFKDDAQAQPLERKLLLGDDMLQDWVTLVLNRKNVREHWRVMEGFGNKENQVQNIFTEKELERAKDLIARVFDQDGYLAKEIRIIRGNEILEDTGANRDVYSFVNSFLKVLKHDVSRKREINYGGDSKAKESNIGQVQELMTLLDNKLPIFTMSSKSASKSDLVDQIAEYTLDRTLSNVRKVDGEPLDYTDRAKMRLYQQAGVVSPTLEMVDLRGMTGDFQKLLDHFKNMSPEAAKGKDSMTSFLRHLSKNENAMANLVSEVNDFKFFTEITEAAEMIGVSPGEFSNQLMTGFNKHIAPYLRGTDGNGFIKVGQLRAKVSPEYLAKLVKQLDLLDYDIARVTHGELMADISKGMNKPFSADKGTSSRIQNLLKNVMDISMLNPSKAAVAQRILAQSGLYTPSERLWNWEDFSNRPEKLNDLLRQVESEINLQFQVLMSHRDLELIHHRDRLDSESKYPVEKPITVNLDAYVKKYKIQELSGSHTKTLSKIFRENVDMMKDPWSFYKHMKGLDAKLTHKGQKIESNRWENDPALNDAHYEFLLDTISIYNQLRNQKTRRLISATSGERNPKHEEITYQDNPIFKEIENIVGELTLIDMNLKKRVDKRVQSFDIRRESTSTGLKREFYKIIGNEAPIFTKGTGKFEDIAQDLGSSTAQSPYIVARLGTLGNGIGIPIGKSSSTNQRITPHMNNVVKAFIDVYRKRKDLLPQEAIDKYDTFIETRLIDRRAEVPAAPEKVGVINLESEGWEYRSGETRYDKIGEDFTLMLTNAVADRTMGNEFWEFARGENWGNNEALAKTPLKYMKLLFNRSAKRFDKKVASDLINVLEKHEMQFLPRDIIGEQDSIKTMLQRFARDIDKGGGEKWHVIRDEGILEGDDIPGVSSLFKRLYEQVKAEQIAGTVKLNDMTSADAFPGGIKDTTLFDSINIVSESYMRTKKFMAAVSDPNVEALKPIGGLPSGSDGVWLDKTVWITDKAWEPYFKRHKIDGVKMGSSVKMAGERFLGAKSETSGRHDKVIYMQDFTTMEGVMKAEHTADKIITLPVESFGISSVIKSQKKATLPIQLSNELITPELNQSYFNWMFEQRLRDFINDSGASFGSGDINDIASKFRLEDMEASTEQLSFMEKWNQRGLDMTFMPIKRQVRNALKRQFLDKRGVFTPTNQFGSQSNMVPTWADYGTEGHLRFTTFKNTDGVRTIHTYGQIEIDTLNRAKPVETKRIRFIEHNEAKKDNIVTKDLLTKDIQTLLNGKKSVNLGEVYDAITEYNKTLKDKSYEVAIVAHRTPTTRASDKVIVGLKGFGDLTGNSVRINHADAWIRLEADYDMDKLNYWWDTPQDILKHWDSLSGKVDSINGVQTRKTIEGLNLIDGKSLVRYNDSERDSQFWRGVVVKQRRSVQFLKAYANADYPEISGFSMKLGKGRIRLADSDVVDTVEKQIAEDIQRIVDAQGKGFDNNIFNKQWSNRILFGDGSDKYPGMVVRESYNKALEQWQIVDKGLTKFEKDIVNAVLSPYKRLLQLQTSIFENGESQKVDYDSLVDYVQIYKKQMNNLHKSVYWNLIKGYTDSKTEWSKARVNEVFKDNRGQFIDPFKLDNAKFGEASEGVDALFDNLEMLASDRMLSVIGSHDRLRMPKIDYQSQTATDEIMMDLFVGNLKDVSAATSRIVKEFKTDAAKIRALNSVDYRLRRYRDNSVRASRVRNTDLASYWTRRADRLKRFRNDLNTTIMSSSKTQSFIRNRVIKQIRKQLAMGRTWTDYKKRPHNLSNVSIPQRNKIINNMSKLIERSVWDVQSNKLAVQIRGINNDDYLQTLAIYNVMSGITRAGLDPRSVGLQTSNQWEMDRSTFRREYSNQFRKHRNGELDASVDVNEIMNGALNELQRLYYEWNQVSPGLGNYFVFSVMTPEMSPYHVTYHKGHLMPGFQQTTTQGKFVNLGFRFFSRIDSSVADHVIDMLGRPISNQIAFLRGKNSDIIMDEHAITEANIRKKPTVDFESAEGGSPLIDYGNTEAGDLKISAIHDHIMNKNRPMDDANLVSMQNLNEHVLRTIGLTGDVALDYIAYKAPALGMEFIGDLKMLADFDFIPSNAITRAGNVVPVGNYNNYLRHQQKGAFMYFGETGKKNMFTGKKDVIAPDIYGTPENDYASKEFMKKQADRFLNEEGC